VILLAGGILILVIHVVHGLSLAELTKEHGVFSDRIIRKNLGFFVHVVYVINQHRYTLLALDELTIVLLEKSIQVVDMPERKAHAVLDEFLSRIFHKNTFDIQISVLWDVNEIIVELLDSPLL